MFLLESEISTFVLVFLISLFLGLAAGGGKDEE